MSGELEYTHADLFVLVHELRALGYRVTPPEHACQPVRYHGVVRCCVCDAVLHAFGAEGESHEDRT